MYGTGQLSSSVKCQKIIGMGTSRIKICFSYVWIRSTLHCGISYPSCWHKKFIIYFNTLTFHAFCNSPEHIFVKSIFFSKSTMNAQLLNANKQWLCEMHTNIRTYVLTRWQSVRVLLLEIMEVFALVGFFSEVVYAFHVCR